MEKFNIVLDLDNSLISSIPMDTYKKLSKKNIDKMNSMTHYQMNNVYMVFERPCLQEFLNYIFENFNVSVWSAASKDYVLFIVKHILLNGKNRKIDYIFYAYHCDVSLKYYKNPKKLNLLWEKFKLPQFNKNNTIIIDDLDDVADKQKCNVFHIKNFEFTNSKSENDNHLCKLLTKVKNLKSNVCPVKQIQ